MLRKKIIAIIPARGGSKGISRKNIKLLAGKPMIAYCLEAARQVKALDRVIVSTEDAEISAVAKRYGAEVPFLRPAELAGDEVATLPVLQHALQVLNEQENYIPDYVLLLYPTSPLLSAARIAEAITLATKHDADSVVSGVYDQGHYWLEDQGAYKRLYPLQLENRQRSKPLFRENGALYLTKTAILKKQIVGDKMVPLVMGQEENIDVDEPSDFLKVEKILSERTQT